MKKLGTVTKIQGSDVLVTIQRDSACGDNCAACGLCRNSREMIVKIKNTQDFKAGDKVCLLAEDKSFLRSSAAGYLSLTTLLILGGVIGAWLKSDWTAFLGALLGLFVGVLLLRLFFTKDMKIEAIKIEE